MAYRIFCERLLRGEPITVFGDGAQSRSNTYVSDCVSATVAALVSLARLPVLDHRLHVQFPGEDGDGLHEGDLPAAAHVQDGALGRAFERRTVADTARARALLGWEPKVAPEEGLAEQVRWVRERATGASRGPAGP